MVTLVNGFVGGTVRGLHDRAGAERDTGVTDQQWWEATAPYFARVFDADRYPTVARVGRSPAPNCRPRTTRCGPSSSGWSGCSTGSAW